MICYKDMTFCRFYEDCKHQDKCLRPFTPEVQREAEKWMKNSPVCYYISKPDCHERQVWLKSK